jgi:hypothetical protein
MVHFDAGAELDNLSRGCDAEGIEIYTLTFTAGIASDEEASVVAALV